MAVPVSIRPSTAPTAISWSGAATISASTPSQGAAISFAALAVSTTTRESPARTAPPAATSHSTTVALSA